MKLIILIVAVLLIAAFFALNNKERPLEDYETVSFKIPSVKNIKDADNIFVKLVQKTGIVKVLFKESKNNVFVYFDSKIVSKEQIKRRLQKAGYRIVSSSKHSEEQLQILKYKVDYNPTPKI
jgi:copper chaperone CopZ